MKKSYEMDMCSGPILKKLVLFALPLVLSSILQLLFNAADIAVVGKFSGNAALAAVGSTGSLINLFINFFMGFSVGVNVIVAQYYGANDRKNVAEAVNTAILVSFIFGVVLIFLGQFFAVSLLRMTNVPEDVIDQAALYMRIYFIGSPAFLSYNFGAAVLRAVGDARRPLYFLAAAGVLNVILNLFFVIAFNMGAAGVALATVISQYLSAILVLRCLVKTEGIYRLDYRRMQIRRDKCLSMLKIGLPAGLQSTMFSISNILIQSTINTFGSVVVAANAACGNIEGFVYGANNAVYQANLSFTSQNMGAKKLDRIGRILRNSLLITAVCSVGLAIVVLGLNQQLLSIYTTDATVKMYGALRLKSIVPFYFLCGAMEVLVGSIRGMGYSVVPMISSVGGVCVFRIIWIYTVFALCPTLEVLYLSYAASWIVTILVNGLYYRHVKKKVVKQYASNL